MHVSEENEFIIFTGELLGSDFLHSFYLLQNVAHFPKT